MKRVFFFKTLLFIILAACSTSPEKVALQTQIAATATVASWTDTPTIAPTLTPTPTATLIPTPTLTPSPTPTLGVGSTMVNPVDSITLVYVPEGEFEMGSYFNQIDELCEDSAYYYKCIRRYEDELPAHNIFLDEYWIYQTEVTNSMFLEFLNDREEPVENGRNWFVHYPDDVHIHPKGNSLQVDYGYENHPVQGVTWYDAYAYCGWAGGRLPTEAEWEKAARGLNGGSALFENNFNNCNLANFNYCYGGTTPVGNYPDGASPYGVLDMLGNISEWVSDWYNKEYYKYFYAGEAPFNPTGPSSGEEKVVRGAAYTFWSGGLRETFREDYYPAYDFDRFGFRCVQQLNLLNSVTLEQKPTQLMSPTRQATVSPVPAGTVVEEDIGIYLTISITEDKKTVELWNGDGSKVDDLWKFPKSSILHNIEWSPQGKFFAVTSCQLKQGVEEKEIGTTTCGVYKDIPRCPDSAWPLLSLDDAENISQCDLNIISSDGSDIIQLPIKLGDPHFDWSPNGHAIAFISHQIDDAWDLYIIDSKTFEVTRLTNSPIKELFPVFSPEGNKILYYTTDGKVYAIDIETMSNTFIGEGWWNEYAWSPDGNKIILSTQIDYYSNVYLVHYDGSRRIPLTERRIFGLHGFLKFDDRDPMFSPDGEKVLFRAFTFDDRIRFPPHPRGNYFFITSTDKLEDPILIGSGFKASWSSDGQWVFVHGWPTEKNPHGPPIYYAVRSDGVEYILFPNEAYGLVYGIWQPGSEPNVGSSIAPYKPITLLKDTEIDEGMMIADNRQQTNNWIRSYNDPIDLTDNFSVTVNFAGYDPKADIILLTGRPYQQNWWQYVIRMEIEPKGDNIVQLGFRDGRAEDSIQYIYIDQVYVSKPFKIIFNDSQGKSFSVINHLGKKVAEYDVTSLEDVNLPDGLFPDSVLYPGILVEPGSILRIKEFHIAMQYE